MRFAENGKISHRQLYRQIVMAFLAPFFLCLFSWGEMTGSSAMAAVFVVGVVLFFYTVFLIRIGGVSQDLKKTAGMPFLIVMTALFLAYILFTAVPLLRVIEQVVLENLLIGVSGKWILLTAVLVSGMGSHQSMQRRGRIAEVSGWLFLAGVILMLLFSIRQGSLDGIREMLQESDFSIAETLRQSYWLFCAFSGMAMLPFVINMVEKPAGTQKTVTGAIVTIGLSLLSVQLLLAANFGWRRLFYEEWPILPLLSGAKLPGDILSGYDALWLGLLLYGLLFSLGSLFHYGHQILKKTGFETGRFWIAATAFLCALWKGNGIMHEELYRVFLGYIFVPGILLLQLLLWSFGKKRWKKRGALLAMLCVCSLFFSACAGMDPEKRIYPLVMGIGYKKGNYQVTYVPPDMQKITGQDKGGGEAKNQNITVEGEDFDKIRADYDATQEKYLDLGHLEILILEKELCSEAHQTVLIRALREARLSGEELLVFQTEDIEKLFKWQSADGSSAGEYILGILENRIQKQEDREIHLKEIYRAYFDGKEFPVLPELILFEEELLLTTFQERVTILF